MIRSPRIHIYRPVFAAMLFSLGTAVACHRNPAFDSIRPISKAELTRQVSRIKGPPVALFFWAAWCPNCKALLQRLSELQRKYTFSRLRVIAVSVDSPGNAFDKALTEFLYNQSILYRKYVSIGPNHAEIVRIFDPDAPFAVPLIYIIDRDKRFGPFIGRSSFKAAQRVLLQSVGLASLGTKAKTRTYSSFLR